MNRQSTGVDTKALKEAAYKVETYVYEVIGKFSKRSKSYNISFQIGVIILQDKIK